MLVTAGSAVRGVAIIVLLAALAGCAASAPSPGSSGATPATAASSSSDAGTRPVITVPGLNLTTATSQGTAPGRSAATSGSPAPPDLAPVAASVTAASVTAGSSAVRSKPATSPTNGPAGDNPDTRSAAPTSRPAAGTPPGPATRPPGPAPAVDLSHCPGCVVIAEHAGVAGSLAAALARTPGGALLLSVRPDGSIAGVINVPYGASFPAPAGGALPCDRSARCVVTGRQPNGDAILSAFQLASNGAWRDVSGNDAFPSATARGAATDVSGDGLLDIAIQESGGGLTGWMVFAWAGDRFAVLGCAPDSVAPPSAGSLSSNACLS